MQTKLKNALILSDGRKGHESQSIAFCKYFECEYEILRVSYANKFLKTLSYVLAFLGIWIKIFKSKELDENSKFDFIVSAGSTTYYPLKYFSCKFNAKSVAMMSPSGYKTGFDIVFAMEHDAKNAPKNAILIPINLTCLEEKHYFSPTKKAIGIVIGGDSKHYKMDEREIKNTILELKNSFKEYEILITTSPRTPKNVEEFLKQEEFDFKVIYSQKQINPIYDFLTTCEYIFITSDSTSMISEAVSFGKASVQVLKLKSKEKNTKFDRFLENLENLGLIHIYDKSVKKTAKFDIKQTIKRLSL
ncbi:ELM1/GtrOC1 family putative glycosyltransferase [Campylobacter geochelonis]|uniref:Protein of uncharacterized function (DUF1022) n=1 Tax=Campylobacter geochelonis TaxID=1780362 RepID=A0A128EKK2_9BACT|nr:ELM1/GtrOC1 family putative glycosyltransferase [Campylobacter geochelonis]QKF71549.1 mitochondrial fission domain-containing protein [Campylobacter geochelonis]CZE49091.1 Protein of uncharacterised function (DUF1022) [Campylobacter geochelonis]